MSDQAESLTAQHTPPSTKTQARHSVASEREAPRRGRGSVAWKINCETATLLGWGPAILLQVAHPLVAAGVAAHSVAISQPELRLRRLGQTIRAMLAITFGTDEEVARAALTINRIHDRVNGTLNEAHDGLPVGTPYSAHDPALLAWVHATLLDMLPRAYEMFVGPLTDVEKDRYCAEATMMGPLLGIPDSLLPHSYAELQRYLDATIASGTIAVGPAARELARTIVAPTVPRWAPLVAPLSRLTTVGLLPPAIRAAYGFRWTSREERMLRAFAAVARLMIPRLPALLHHWPTARVARRAHE